MNVNFESLRWFAVKRWVQILGAVSERFPLVEAAPTPYHSRQLCLRSAIRRSGNSDKSRPFLSHLDATVCLIHREFQQAKGKEVTNNGKSEIYRPLGSLFRETKSTNIFAREEAFLLFFFYYYLFQKEISSRNSTKTIRRDRRLPIGGLSRLI